MSTFQLGTIKSLTASTPPLVKDSNGVEIGQFCRAWVNFNGVGTVAIRDSLNCSSITDNGIGDYTMNLSVVMANTNYGNVMSAGRPNNTGSSGTNYMASPKLAVAKTTSALRMVTAYADTTPADTDDISIVIFGD